MQFPDFVQIDELETKKDLAKEEAQAEYEETMQNLKSTKIKLQENYDALIDASDEKWDEVKRAFSSATDSFKEGFSKIASLF